MKPISEQTRHSVLSLIDAGFSSRQIASQLGICHTTVIRVRAVTRRDAQTSRGGRPAKLTATNKRTLVSMVTSGKADTAIQLTRELRNTANIDINANTVRRALKGAGLKAAPKQNKPRLLPKHIRQRLDFAERYQHWTAEDWKRVVWSDETKINRLGSDGREWVWRKPGDRLAE